MIPGGRTSGILTSLTDGLCGILVEAIWGEPLGQWYSKASGKASAGLADCTTMESSGETALRTRDPQATPLEILLQLGCGGAWVSRFFRSTSNAFIGNHYTNLGWRHLWGALAVGHWYPPSSLPTADLPLPLPFHPLPFFNQDHSFVKMAGMRACKPSASPHDTDGVTCKMMAKCPCLTLLSHQLLLPPQSN